VKTRSIWILAALALVIIVAAAALIVSLYVVPYDLAFEKDEGLPEGKSVLIRTNVEGFGIHKGDAIKYFVDVLYDPDQVAEIDKTSIDSSLSFKPLEIRDTKETEFDFDDRTRIYRREYEIQLIDGQVDTLYEFPSIVVRYKHGDTGKFYETSLLPEPIYVSARLPSDVSSLELRPTKGSVAAASQKSLPWILWALGGLLTVLGAGDLAWRVSPQMREKTKQRRKAEGVDVLSQACQSLHMNVAVSVEPKLLLHQMEHILRIVLARKEGLDWLEEINFDVVSSEIRPCVLSLFENCQKAHLPATPEQEDVEQTLKQLEEILNFYFGKRAAEIWNGSPVS
jgi:hypothetical protein